MAFLLIIVFNQDPKWVLYNGTGGYAYNTRSLSGIVPDQQDGFGTISFSYPTNGIQNGAPDGIALIDNNDTVVQLLSYEGSFTAVGGPATGLISTGIRVAATVALIKILAGRLRQTIALVG